MDPWNPIVAKHAQSLAAHGADALFRERERERRAPAAAWLALHAVALWPSFAWAARRLADGSDEPLGLIALGLLALAALGGRLACRSTPRPGWAAGSVALVVGATAALAFLPPLAVAVLAALALAAAWAAFRRSGSAVAPVLGLLLLALPVIASLQFYAGHPLRWLTAQASAALLHAAGVAAEPSGAALVVEGRWVLVDAPCSGVQLAWMAYAAACAVALHGRVGDAAFLRRLPLVGLLALAGNVVRNTVLVAIESGLMPAPAWAHDAVGLVVLAAVCAAVAGLLTPRKGGIHAAR